MATTLQNEIWKNVSFGFKCTNNYRLQVSNRGQIRAYNKFSAGGLLKGSTINGYRIIRVKLYKPKDMRLKDKLVARHSAIVTLRDRLNKWRPTDPKKNKSQLAADMAKLGAMQDALRIARQQDIKNRTIHYHSLIHRLVAAYFVKPKSAEHTVVGHLDHNKMNNVASNLKWMTPLENFAHQQLSPHVIKEKKKRIIQFRKRQKNQTINR